MRSRRAQFRSRILDHNKFTAIKSYFLYSLIHLFLRIRQNTSSPLYRGYKKRVLRELEQAVTIEKKKFSLSRNKTDLQTRQ